MKTEIKINDIQYWDDTGRTSRQDELRPEETAGTLPPRVVSEGQDSGEGPPANPGASWDHLLHYVEESARITRLHIYRLRAKEAGYLVGWMIENGFTTGHGDTMEDLLRELTRQVGELKIEARIVPLPKKGESE